ncbi:DUF748 domain-containing protein [Chryseolinea soli]|uniref:DUF748 domain-containing protein n=1 Tax=Chryseolinea soli TaxID=2321403 RepID=A0A385SHB4_9BACT|nr:DUF748 domain-containing protein [Chryseolinea soli]AYB29841.1 DUF748 domain-containing protein [Chryseolinea soli]
MKPFFRSRWTRWVLLPVLLLSIVLFVAGVVLSRIVKAKAIAALEEKNGTLEDLHVNLFQRAVTVDGLAWTATSPDTSKIPNHIAVKRLRMSGIHVLAWLIHKDITVDKIELTEGDATYSVEKAVKKDSARRSSLDAAPPSPFKMFSVGELVLKNVKATIHIDSLQTVSGDASITLTALQFDPAQGKRDLSALKIKSVQADFTSVQLSSKLYITKISSVHLNSAKGKLSLDSISLTPKYGRYAFARKVGRQTDRFTLRIPEIALEGLVFNPLNDSTVVSSVHIVSARLHVFRDKRFPFVKHHNVPLPVAMIRKFPFALQIDSVKISNARIVYEEFPEKGFHTGQVEFDDLNATLTHVDNRDSSAQGKATLVASAKLMGKGLITSTFLLPYGKQQSYRAEGHVRNLPLPALNRAMENMAFVNIVSGKLSDLYFDFYYNDDHSKGSILVNYENLKINGLTKEKQSHASEFKTWLINLFIKNDKDKTVSEAKRLGVIDFERDKRKAIFNLWWKSLLSGLKSSVLDGPAKKEKETGRKKKD